MNRTADIQCGTYFLHMWMRSMAYISNVMSYRPASMNQVNQDRQTGAISNRHTGPLEQTTSAQTGGSTRAEDYVSTYAHLAQQGKRGPSVISSQDKVANSNGAPTKAPIDNFEAMGAFKSLVSRYQNMHDRADMQTSLAERFQLEHMVGKRKFVNDGGINQISGVKEGELFSLTLKTKEGDTVSFAISAEVLNGFDKDTANAAVETDFLFTVIGSLSDKEREAVNSLVGRLGDMARDYQQHGWTKVDFLEGFDDDQLAELSLNVQGEHGHSLAVTYSRDGTSVGAHKLEVNQNGYEYALTADGILSKGHESLQENLLYQQYQQVLLDTTRSYKAGEFSGGIHNTKAAEFFLDGLEAILANPNDIENATHHTDASGDSGLTNKISGQIDSESLDSAETSNSENRPSPRPKEGDFLSGLADFSASFNTPRFLPNASNSAEVSQMTLSMEQVTEVSVAPSDGEKTLHQSYSFDSVVSQHFGVGGDSIKYANLAGADEPGGQTYLYKVIKQSATLARTLTLDRDQRILGYEENKDSEHAITSKKVINGNIEDIKREVLDDPKDNYALALQIVDESRETKIHALQVDGYKDIQILEEAIKSEHVNLYS